MRTVGIASLPERQEHLILVVNSLLPQVDKVYIALNNYSHIPQQLQDNPKISATICDNSLGDGAKFLHVDRIDGMYFSCDDDIIYPANYCGYMESKAKQYGCIVTLHGRRYDKPILKSRRSFTLNYHCLHTYKEDMELHLGGTGVMCFDTSVFRPAISRFLEPNMADIWVAKQANEQGIRIMGVAHKNTYLRYLHQNKTIWTTCTPEKEAYQTAVLKNFLKK